MEQQDITNLGLRELSPHRWRIGVILAFFGAFGLWELASAKFTLVKVVLVLAFALGGCFGAIPLWEKFASSLAMGIVLWLLPILVLAGINLLLMSTIAEGPVLVYLVAPFFRLLQPKKDELLPSKMVEWGVILLLLGLMLAISFLPWAEFFTGIITRRM